MSILGAIFGALNPIEAITKSITSAYIERQKATTDIEKIAADERIRTLEQRRAVLVAEAPTSRLNQIVRAGFSVPPMLLLAKIYLWDKMLGEWTQGRTDALDDNLWKVIAATIGFYFLTEITLGAARILKRRP